MHVPTLQGLLSSFSGSVHTPVALSQAPTVWHSSSSLQVIWTPPQIPLPQVSDSVHLLPSSHMLPSGFATGAEHIPVAGSHMPTYWQVSGVMHATGFAPTQLPA